MNDDNGLLPPLRVVQPDAISGDFGSVLDQLERHLRRFVAFTSEHQPVAIVLWVAHTHAAEAAEQSPILAVLSPVKRSGKTRLLDAIEHVVREPWRVVRPSESVLFRKIDRDRPTLMLDEADTIFTSKQDSEGLRAILNAGNRRGTSISRSVAQGKNFDLVDFQVYCPKAIAGIGDLPDTVRDRSIVIMMARKAPGTAVERLRARDAFNLGTPFHNALDHQLAAIDELSMPDDELPVELDDRAQDCWEPLLALAQLAGGGWPARARRAAIALSLERGDAEDDSLGILLLRDTQTVFESDTFMSTTMLIERLCGLELGPWADQHGKPITGRRLAKLLREFGIRPVRDRASNGYSKAHFADAWSRYLPARPETTSTTSTTSTPEAETPVPVELVELVELAPARGATPDGIECNRYDEHRFDHRWVNGRFVCDACAVVGVS